MNQSDLPLEVKLHRIGPCPVCGKGQMLQGSAGWTCDYFRSLTDKCAFTIFAEYDGYVLTEQDALELMRDGLTGERQFMTRGGVPFTGRLKREGERIKVLSSSASMGVPCPLCGGKVRITQKGYGCVNFFRDGADHCKVWISSEICGRRITEKEVETLLEKGRTEVLDGFVANGKTFSSCLVINKQGEVTLDSDICRCPKCGGRVHAGIKAFNCSNFRNPSVKCDFVVWRRLSGRWMTVDDVRTLCEQGHTPVLTFQTREGIAYEKRLVLAPDGRIVFG